MNSKAFECRVISTYSINELKTEYAKSKEDIKCSNIHLRTNQYFGAWYSHIRSTRSDAIILEYGHLRKKIQANNLRANVGTDSVLGATSSLQSRRFRYEIERLSLIYTNDSVIGECIVSYPCLWAKCQRARISSSRAD